MRRPRRPEAGCVRASDLDQYKTKALFCGAAEELEPNLWEEQRLRVLYEHGVWL
jgi:hypothetical protein